MQHSTGLFPRAGRISATGKCFPYCVLLSCSSCRTPEQAARGHQARPPQYSIQLFPRTGCITWAGFVCGSSVIFSCYSPELTALQPHINCAPMMLFSCFLMLSPKSGCTFMPSKSPATIVSGSTIASTAVVVTTTVASVTTTYKRERSSFESQASSWFVTMGMLGAGCGALTSGVASTSPSASEHAPPGAPRRLPCMVHSDLASIYRLQRNSKNSGAVTFWFSLAIPL